MGIDDDYVAHCVIEAVMARDMVRSAREAERYRTQLANARENQRRVGRRS